MSPTTTSELIAAVGDRLTPTERRIADAVLEEPTLLAFGTVSDLAGSVGTSRPSIVRFANKLGFSGYSDLQNHVRLGLSQQLSRPSERIRHDDAAPGTRGELEDALASVFEATAGERLAALAKPIVRAEHVWILTGETAGAGAAALRSGLAMLRPGVRLVEPGSVARDLSSAGLNDVAVVFDFYRYRGHSTRSALILADLGVQIVAITDGPLSPLAALTETWCAVRVPAIGPFDSSVPAVAVAELLVAYVASQLHSAATDRIDRIEDLWAATEEFIPAP
jgi:DNA-binding MurR/RpiR family transcriptional regulator